MKISYVEKKLVLKFVLVFLFIFLTIAANTVSSSFHGRMIQKKDQTQEGIAKASRKIKEFNAHKDTLHYTIKLWEQIESKEESSMGLEIDEGYKILNFLKEKYNLNSLQATLSTPEILEQRNIAEKDIAILRSEVELQIKSATDSEIYSLIQDVADSFPGYVGISSLRVTETKRIGEAMIEQIEQTGILPDLIETYVIFEWRDIKSLNKESL